MINIVKYWRGDQSPFPPPRHTTHTHWLAVKLCSCVCGRGLYPSASQTMCGGISTCLGLTLFPNPFSWDFWHFFSLKNSARDPNEEAKTVPVSHTFRFREDIRQNSRKNVCQSSQLCWHGVSIIQYYYYYAYVMTAWSTTMHYADTVSA